MLIGAELELFPEWRLVEGDLYNITGRVREYDADARLVINEDGVLGLARYMRESTLLPGGAIIPARTCVDWSAVGQDPLPDLTGEPDARVLWDQRVADSHRIRNQDSWNRRRRDMVARAKARKTLERKEWSAEMAARYVNIAQRKDIGYRPTISVPKAIA